MDALRQILENTLARLDLTDAALEARAVMLWPEIVGRQVARASEARNVRGGVLQVTVRDSAWNAEITFMKPVILRKYRERLGREFVTDLRCAGGKIRGVAPDGIPAPSPVELSRIVLPAETMEAIRKASEGEDPELSQAIRRALTREAQTRQWHLEHGARPCPRCGAAYRTSDPCCPACRQDDRTEKVAPTG